MHSRVSGDIVASGDVVVDGDAALSSLNTSDDKEQLHLALVSWSRV